MDDSIAAQLVHHQPKRRSSLILQELPKEPSGRPPVPTGLHEYIDHVAVLVHRAPEIVAPASNRDKDFVQEPGIT